MAIADLDANGVIDLVHLHAGNLFINSSTPATTGLWTYSGVVVGAS
jgi:hypothetical protein